jgi:acetyl-CoA carboxylase biotin carboxylase subunit
MRNTKLKKFKKILIANRGEIAVRIIRACRELEISPIAIYSTADVDSLHVRLSDEAYLIGGAASRESYLNIEKIIETAKASKAEAIHPGYGFLAENPDFARSCEETGIIFIGPSAKSMKLMGDKLEARQVVRSESVPIVPGSHKAIETEAELQRWAGKIGFPLMLKAVGGGGGKGIRKVESEVQLKSAFKLAKAEAKSAFGDDRIYLEKYLPQARHIEFQILADLHGNIVHLGERECSIQRRHQKLIEEAPSLALEPQLRDAMGKAAVNAAKSANYLNAGTVEFLLDTARNFYFLEMNTRLQVEHPATELVTGIDLVKEQINIAQGAEILFGQADIKFQGWAMECRIYAEDPELDFSPSIGKVKLLSLPGGPGVRLDSGLYDGMEVSIHYDSLIAKLICWGRDRDEAISRARRALNELKIDGVQTTSSILAQLLRDQNFKNGKLDTEFLSRFQFQMNEWLRGLEADGGVEENEAKIATIVALIHQLRVQNASKFSLKESKESDERWPSAWVMAFRPKRVP